MKKKSIYTIAAFASILLVSCSSKKDSLQELLDKKTKLRTELAAIQEEINKLDTKKESDDLPLVTLGELQTQNFQHKLTVQGNVETEFDAIINSEAGGVISKIKVKEGQNVKSGQVLVSIDASIINSSIKEVQTQLDYAEYMLEKQTELKKRGVGSEFEYKGALNQVNSLKSKLKSLDVQKSKSNIVAPFSGTIDQIFTKEGQMASPQARILRIVNTKEITISADLSEKHMQNIQVGTKMNVRFPNFKDTSIQLTVSSVANYIDPVNRTFRITANVKNNKFLVPNMLAELEIIDIDNKNVLVVPSKSILKDYNNNDYIFAAINPKGNEYNVKKIFIKEVQKFDGKSQIELQDKLALGSKIIIDGVKGISESDRVRNK